MKFDIKDLRDFVHSTVREDWWCGAKYADNSKARILPTKEARIKPGTYFLCDCVGNTIDLCKATKRKFRNPAGRMVPCKVIETIIPDCRAKFGTPLNGEWAIPTHLIGKTTVTLPPMQAFALKLLKQYPGAWMSPNELRVAWREHHGKSRYGGGDSRHQFGATSAAYRTLRRLHELGLVEAHDFGGNYYDIRYRIKP